MLAAAPSAAKSRPSCGGRKPCPTPEFLLSQESNSGIGRWVRRRPIGGFSARDSRAQLTERTFADHATRGPADREGSTRPPGAWAAAPSTLRLAPRWTAQDSARRCRAGPDRHRAYAASRRVAPRSGETRRRARPRPAPCGSTAKSGPLARRAPGRGEMNRPTEVAPALAGRALGARSPARRGLREDAPLSTSASSGIDAPRRGPSTSSAQICGRPTPSPQRDSDEDEKARRPRAGAGAVSRVRVQRQARSRLPYRAPPPLTTGAGAGTG